jgi:TolB protein
VLPFVFTSDRDGDNEIYRVRGDGRVVQLTHNDVNDSDAVWSPDGRALAFVSDRDGDLEVFVMDADGSDVHQLTHNAATADDRAWDHSPDGRTIVFSSNRGGADRDLYTMRADGGRVRELTGEVAVDEWFPTWTPDGRQVVYWSLTLDGSARDAAWIVDRAGTDPHRLTSGESNDSFPDARP